MWHLPRDCVFSSPAQPPALHHRAPIANSLTHSITMLCCRQNGIFCSLFSFSLPSNKIVEIKRRKKRKWKNGKMEIRRIREWLSVRRWNGNKNELSSCYWTITDGVGWPLNWLFSSTPLHSVYYYYYTTGPALRINNNSGDRFVRHPLAWSLFLLIIKKNNKILNRCQSASPPVGYISWELLFAYTKGPANGERWCNRLISKGRKKKGARNFTDPPPPPRLPFDKLIID